MVGWWGRSKLGVIASVPTKPGSAIGRELFAGRRRSAILSTRRPGRQRWSRGRSRTRRQAAALRFDVLPALEQDRDLVRHLREYFEGRDAPYATLLNTALGVARVGWLGEKVVGVMLRETVRRLAKRFVAGGTPAEARRAALSARQAGQAFTLDLLGEACLSESEADAYERRYAELLETLGPESARWNAVPLIDRAAGDRCARHLSVKIRPHPGSTPPIPTAAGREATPAESLRRPRPPRARADRKGRPPPARTDARSH